MQVEATLELPDLGGIEQNIKKRAFNAALRRTTQRTHVRGARKIRETLLARQKYVKQAIKSATRIHPDGGTAYIPFSKFSLPLDAFPFWTRRVNNRKGVSIKIKKGRSPKIVRGHFMVQKKNKKLILRRAGDDRYPLKRGYTSGVAAVASNDDFIEDLAMSAEDRFAREAASAMNAFLT